MAKFELKYEAGGDYDNRVELDIRLKAKPEQEDLKSVMGAIDTLHEFAQKYLEIKNPPVKVGK